METVKSHRVSTGFGGLYDAGEDGRAGGNGQAQEVCGLLS